MLLDSAVELHPLISVLTPTWNRAAYLTRVWEGLCSQTFTDFEWVVANDGSTDDTRKVIQELASRSPFPVILIEASVHIGKPRMDNELIRHARGEFLVWNDSDDFLVPSALKQLVDTWNSIAPDARGAYIGVTSHTTFDTTWNDLSERLAIEGDKLFYVRADLTRANKFIEVDFMVIESSFWNAVSDMKTRFLPEVVKIVGREAENRISFSGKMEYCRGKAYGMAAAEQFPRAQRRNLRDRAWKATTFFRYCIHGDIGISAAMRLWGGNLPKPLFLATYPLGVALAFKDRLQGKVRKTHRDFDRAKQEVIITANLLPGPVAVAV
jgi:glycosyltransferase involved in cell wall biosynthesis